MCVLTDFISRAECPLSLQKKSGIRDFQMKEDIQLISIYFLCTKIVQKGVNFYLGSSDGLSSLYGGKCIKYRKLLNR